MANADHQMLINLRNNIVALPQMRKELEEIRSDLRHVDYRQAPVYRGDYQVNRKRLEREYLAPNQKKYKKREKRSNAVWWTLWTLSLLIAIGITLAAVVYAIYSKFGFDFFIRHQWTGIIGNYIRPDTGEGIGIAVPIYLMSAAVCALCVELVFIIGDYDDFAIVGLIASISSIALAVLSLVFVYVSLDFTGFWLVLSIILFPIVFLIFFVICFLRILYGVLIIAIGMGMLAAFGWAFYGLYRWYEHIHDGYCPTLAKEPNLKPLYETPEYKLAEEQDRIDSIPLREEHKKLCAEFELEKKKEKARLNEVIQRMQMLIQNTEKAIQTAPINASYKNIEMLDILLYYFNYNRASTLVEAVNQYTHDMQMRAFMEQMEKQHAEKMNAIDTANAKMNANFAALMKDMEHSRKITESYQNNVLNQLSAIKKETANAAYYTERVWRDM